MIRLGDSGWWLDPTAKGWVLCRVSGKGRQVVNRRYGPFTSVRHVLQQRAVKLPDPVRAELAELAVAGEMSGDEIGQLPVTNLSTKGDSGAASSGA